MPEGRRTAAAAEVFEQLQINPRIAGRAEKTAQVPQRGSVATGFFAKVFGSKLQKGAALFGGLAQFMDAVRQ